MKMNNIQKAYEISDAKIKFVSLVDKAANKKQFLITKAEKGQANFSTYGRIVKADAESHFVTGVVYEPLVEDTDGNYMTEEEITKAAYWFAKNGDSVDLQHSFEELGGAAVVENWVAKADYTIGDEEIKKGTWLMTMEIEDEDVWKSVEKKELTGFSMGGIGKYSEEDVDIETIDTESISKNKGIFKRFASMLGFEVVEKGQVKETYRKQEQDRGFWDAFDALRSTLSRYDYYNEERVFEDDEEKVREALSEFSEIIQGLLLTEDNIAKSLAEQKQVNKAGKKISAANKETLTTIYEQLGTFVSSFEENMEEETVKKQEVEEIVADAVAKAVSKATGQKIEQPSDGTVQKNDELTQESIEDMVTKAIEKALQPQTQEPVTSEQVEEIVTKAVEKAVQPVLAARGLPSNLGGEGTVEKNDKHYLTGVL